MGEEARQSAKPKPTSANEFIEGQLDERLEKIDHSFMADTVAFSGSIEFGVHDVIRDAVERRHAKFTPRQKMVFLADDCRWLQWGK